MNNITMALNADELILSALREDITSEDITTNSVMREYQLVKLSLFVSRTALSQDLTFLREHLNCLTAKQKLLLQKKTEIP